MTRIVMWVLVLCSVLCGCSRYEITDSIADGDRKVTKHSVAGGVIQRPTMPSHEESYIYRDAIASGGTGVSGDGAGGGNWWILYPIGAVAIICGLASAAFFKSYWTGGAVAAGGALVLLVAAMLDIYPWIILLLPVACIVGGLWYVLGSRRGWNVLDSLQAFRKGFEQTVAGFENAKSGSDGEQRSAMNLAMSASQDGDVQQMVQKQKIAKTVGSV